jgi:hypothetical protein
LKKLNQKQINNTFFWNSAILTLNLKQQEGSTQHMISQKKCEELGLNYSIIKQHSLLIEKSIADKNWPQSISVVDTCRFDNHKVLPPIPDSILKDRSIIRQNIAAFIPAAGASSRYTAPFSSLKKYLEAKDLKLIKQELIKLKPLLSRNWVLPHLLSKKLHENCLAVNATEVTELLKELSQPKALFPCSSEGASYLQIKTKEHKNISNIDHQIFVCPEGYEKQFQDNINQAKELSQIKTGYMEQDGSMSTIRFLPNGDPAIDPQTNSYSKVPAGHGSLLQLFPKIKTSHPSLDGLFIRNIDNVTGTSKEVISATDSFLASFNLFMNSIKIIRKALASKNMILAAEKCLALTESFCPSTCSEQQKNILSQCENDDLTKIWMPLLTLFHHSPASQSSLTIDNAIKLYERPLNILGVVANNGTDVGGSPVVINHKSHEIKVCLELPHATDEDQKKYFFDPEQATHFNPVFVAAELQESISTYVSDESPFWLLAQKKWNGLKVQYFETVLYELLGNSNMANVIFLEVPRSVFNPHKSLDDTSFKPTKT